MFLMNIETEAGVKQHGYHLGTIIEVAETFIFEQLRKPTIKSVALYSTEFKKGLQPVRIYDGRDLPETQNELAELQEIADEEGWS